MGNRIRFGDATHEEILSHAGIGKARALVIAIPEYEVVPGIIHIAGQQLPDCHILVRARHVSEVQHLLETGADEVIPEEFGASVEVFCRILSEYSLPEQETLRMGDKILRNGYRMFTRDHRETTGTKADHSPTPVDPDLHILHIARGSKLPAGPCRNWMQNRDVNPGSSQSGAGTQQLSRRDRRPCCREMISWSSMELNGNLNGSGLLLQGRDSRKTNTTLI